MSVLRSFIKEGLIRAIGKKDDCWIIMNAAGWFEKNVLVENDLQEIQMAIDDYNEKQKAIQVELFNAVS